MYLLHKGQLRHRHATQHNPPQHGYMIDLATEDETFEL